MADKINDLVDRDTLIEKITSKYRTSSGNAHSMAREILDIVYDAPTVEYDHNLRDENETLKIVIQNMVGKINELIDMREQLCHCGVFSLAEHTIFMSEMQMVKSEAASLYLNGIICDGKRKEDKQ